MRFLFWILIVVSIIVALFVLLRVAISKIYFKFDLAGIDITKLTLANITQAKVVVKINASVQNENNFKINFSDLFVQFFHNNELIATSQDIDTKKYTIPAKGKFQFQEDIDIYINRATIKIASDIVAKKAVEIEYHVRVKIFNINIPSIVDKFTI